MSKQLRVVLKIDTTAYVDALAWAPRRTELYEWPRRTGKTEFERAWLNRWVTDGYRTLRANRLSHPVPLCIDGHAYARRRKNRKGRR